MPDPNDVEIRRQREKFVKAFDDLAEATKNLSAIAKKQIELMNQQIEAINGFSETMMMPKDGMRDVLDELIDEIRGLREDIRIVADSGGFPVMLRALLGRGKPR